MICMEIAAAREVPSRLRFVELAHACGFALAGVAPARPLDDFGEYERWVSDGLAGPLGYLTDHRMAIRANPRQLLASARSVLCLGMLYNTEVTEPRPSGSASMDASTPARFSPVPRHTTDTAPLRSRLRYGIVSRYAWGAGDYHDILRERLETLAKRLQAHWGEFEYRVCVETAPLLERSYARAAGLGWIGRNTCLINEPLGSWFFLGEILISIELPPDSPPPDRCGSCMRCVDACPTQALVPAAGTNPEQYRLDARLCISTLTIEQKGPAPEATRQQTGSHLFGCDICQEVCPWNRRSPVTGEPAFQPLYPHLDLSEAAALTSQEFRRRFRHTPVWRAKFEGWIRNVATAMGNSGDPVCIEPLRALARSDDPGISAHANWALRRLEGPDGGPDQKVQA